MRHPVGLVGRILSPLADHMEDLARYLSLAAVVLTLLLSVPGRAMAETAQHYARLSHVDGHVQVLQGDQTAFAQAVPNMPLAEGSRLQTGDDGRAEVQFENGSIARLTPKSSMTLTQIQRGPDGAANTQVEMLSGLGYFELRSRGGEDSLVFGSNTVVPVDGSAIVRMNMDANPVELSVVDGNIHVTSGTQFAVDVHANETLRFDAADAARYFLAEEVTADSWDGWNNDRDQALSQQAMKRTEASQAAANSGGGGGGMGWSDLDQNGNWYSMPGYGNVWAPYGMTAGWDPYGSGYWGNYGGGYQWISGYSWGWTPYRCGGWNYFNSFGWGWMPNGCGGYGNGFGGGGGYGTTTSVVILNRPPGYLLPKPPQGVHPPLRPGPPTGVGMAKNGSMLIPVNRGPAATQLKPMNEGTVQPAKPIMVNGSVIRPLPLRPVAENSFARGTTIHPVSPTQQAPAVNVYHVPVPANSLTEPMHGTAVAPVARPAASATQVISTPTQLLTPTTVTSAPVASQSRTAPAAAPLPQVMVPSAAAPAAHPATPTAAPRYVPPPSATQAPRYNPPPSSAQAPSRYSPPPSYSSPSRSSAPPSSMGGGGGGGGSHPSGSSGGGGGGGQSAPSHK